MFTHGTPNRTREDPTIGNKDPNRTQKIRACPVFMRGRVEGARSFWKLLYRFRGCRQRTRCTQSQHTGRKGKFWRHVHHCVTLKRARLKLGAHAPVEVGQCSLLGPTFLPPGALWEAHS